jgi:hypothetical protein
MRYPVLSAGQFSGRERSRQGMMDGKVAGLGSPEFQFNPVLRKVRFAVLNRGPLD